MRNAGAARAIDVVTVQVAKLSLQPGEVLLVKVPKADMDDFLTRRALRRELHAAFPNITCLLASDDMDFSVIQPPPPMS